MRSFLLGATGYAKDGEPNAAYSTTVAPLPFHAMPNYPPGPADHASESLDYHQYLRRYQTPPAYRLIAPLASQSGMQDER